MTMVKSGLKGLRSIVIVFFWGGGVAGNSHSEWDIFEQVILEELLFMAGDRNSTTWVTREHDPWKLTAAGAGVLHASGAGP